MPAHLQSASSAPRPPLAHAPEEPNQTSAAAADRAAPAPKRKLPFRPLRPRANAAFEPDAAPPKMEPLEMNDLQSAFISDTTGEPRRRAAKRRRTGDGPRVSFADGSWDCGDVDDGASGRFDILDELDAHPDVVRVVATVGGLITHWNEGFAGLTRPSASLRRVPLTVFELVDPKSLPKLYGMLALSLHDVGIVGAERFRLDEEDGEGEEGSPSPPSHLSIALPCKRFPGSSTHYDITVVFVPDAAPTGRRFLGILVPRSDGGGDDCDCDDGDGSLSTGRASLPAPPRRLPRGRIVRVDDELLCRRLLGPGDAVG